MNAWIQSKQPLLDQVVNERPLDYPSSESSAFSWEDYSNDELLSEVKKAQAQVPAAVPPSQAS